MRALPVRADAEGLFVPVAELPDAAVGDVVVIVGPDGEDRRGVIAEQPARGDEPCHRLELEG